VEGLLKREGVVKLRLGERKVYRDGISQDFKPEAWATTYLAFPFQPTAWRNSTRFLFLKFFMNPPELWLGQSSLQNLTDTPLYRFFKHLKPDGEKPLANSLWKLKIPGQRLSLKFTGISEVIFEKRQPAENDEF